MAKDLFWGGLGGAAVLVLAGMVWQQNQLQQAQLDAMRRQDAQMERLLQGLAVPAVAGQPSPWGATLKLAERWLAERVSPDAGRRGQAKADDVDAAIQLSCHTDREVVDGAVRLLGKLKGPRAEARLFEMVEENSNALGMLYGINRVKAEAIVAEWLKSDNPERVQAAVSALQSGRGMISKEMVPQVLAALRAMGGGQSGRNQRSSLTYVLRELRDPRVCPVMLELMRDETEEYQLRQFFTILVANATRQELATVLAAAELVKGGNDTEVGQGLVAYFSRVRDLRGTPFLLRLLKSNQEYTQRNAMLALLRIGDPLAAGELLELATKKPTLGKELTTFVQENGHPGLLLVGDKLQLAGDEEMKRLLAEREEMLRKLVEPPPVAPAAP